MKVFETQDAAHVLGLSPVRVRQLADTGALPVLMRTVGGRRLFDAGVVEAFRRERIRSRPGQTSGRSS